MNATLLAKIEELTLYVLDLKRENQQIQRQSRQQNATLRRVVQHNQRLGRDVVRLKRR